MRAWRLAVIVPYWLAAGPLQARPPKPAPNVLRRPGETTLFSFVTRSGKTASLCEGPRGAYLVYRFGTVTKVELQYPAVLDANSWKKFIYNEYHRGGGAHNAGRDTHRLSFSIGAIDYMLWDEARDIYSKQHQEEEHREVGIWVYSKAKSVFIAGKESSADWYLDLNEKQRKKVKLTGLPSAD